MKNITFKQFIYTYNFRYSNDLSDGDLSNDTVIIRIHYPIKDMYGYKDKWIEFGIYDFGCKKTTWEICEDTLSENILNSYVNNIQYNEDFNRVVTIYLTNENEYTD